MTQTRIEALEELAAKIETGEAPEAHDITSALRGIYSGGEAVVAFARMACDASDIRAMGAALAFHSAVLPGWEWWVNSQHYWDGSEGPLAILRTGVPGIDLKVATGKDDNPARALLLATIKALIENENAGQ